MSQLGTCQRCGDAQSSWRLSTAELNVGPMQYWKLQLCHRCTHEVYEAVYRAIQKPEPR